jgi:hypothetical protein
VADAEWLAIGFLIGVLVGIPELKAGDVFSGIPPETGAKFSRMFSRSRAVETNGLWSYPFRERTHFGCLVANYETRGDIHRANVPLLKAHDESCALAAPKLFMAGGAPEQARLRRLLQGDREVTQQAF